MFPPLDFLRVDHVILSVRSNEADVNGDMKIACPEGDIRACKLAFAFRRAAVLEKQQGPDYLALFGALNEVGPNSKDVQDFLSIFAWLDDSCPHQQRESLRSAAHARLATRDRSERGETGRGFVSIPLCSFRVVAKVDPIPICTWRLFRRAYAQD